MKEKATMKSHTDIWAEAAGLKKPIAQRLNLRLTVNHTTQLIERAHLLPAHRDHEKGGSS